jgi:4-hydroxybenzoate polyprenyltransferase
MDNDKPINAYLMSVFGLGLVSVTCLFAGHAISQGPKWTLGLVFWGVLQWIVTMPYLLQREVLVERSVARNNKWAMSGLDMFAVIILVTCSSALASDLNNLLQKPEGNIGVQLAGLIITPFAYLYFRTRSINWSESSQIAAATSFGRRTLIPALFCCIIPFLTGWYLGSKEELVWAGTTAIMALIFWDVLAGPRISARRHQLFFIGFFLVACGLTVFKIAIGRALLFGIVMTLSMGVAEVCKLATVYAKSPTSNDARFCMSGANWSSVALALGLHLLPLLDRDFPTWPAVLLAWILIVHWGFTSKAYRSSKLAWWISLLFGYSIPILVCIATFVWSTPPYLFTNSILNSATAAIGLVFTVLFTFVAIFFNKDTLVRFKNDFVKDGFFLVDENCRTLFAIALPCTVAIVCIMASTILTAEEVKNELVYAKKATDLVASLFFMAVACYFFYRPDADQTTPKDGAAPPADPSNNKPDQSIRSSPKKSSRRYHTPNKMIADLAESSRWHVAVIAACPLWVASWSAPIKSTTAVWLGISIWLVTMSGFLLNDIFDYEKDKIGGRNRPICNDRLSRKIAGTTAILFSTLSIVFGLASGNDVAVHTIVAINFGVLAYSKFSKLLPWAKGLYTAILCCTPILLTYIGLDQRIDLPLLSVLFIFCFSRELLMDATEISSDMKSQIKTLAFHLGESIATAFSWFGMFTGTVLFLYFVSDSLRPFAFLALALTIVSYRLSITRPLAAIDLTRAPMLVGALVVGLGVQ